MRTSSVESLTMSIREAREANPLSNFAVLDFDKTVTTGDCAEATLHHMARKNLPNARDYFEYYYFLLDQDRMEEAYRFGASTIAGMSVEEVDAIVQEALRFESTTIRKEKMPWGTGRTVSRGIALRENVAGLIPCLQAEGIEVWIVSASPELIVRPTMKYFGLHTKFIGVRNIVRNGIVTEELQPPLSILGGKVDCIQELIHPTAQPCFGAGDSPNDGPMVRYSLVRGVVDRGNALAEEAKANGWFIF